MAREAKLVEVPFPLTDDALSHVRRNRYRGRAIICAAYSANTPYRTKRNRYCRGEIICRD